MTNYGRKTLRRTKVVREGSARFQARYYDPEIKAWFDIGDPEDTEAEAEQKARDWKAMSR